MRVSRKENYLANCHGKSWICQVPVLVLWSKMSNLKLELCSTINRTISQNFPEKIVAVYGNDASSHYVIKFCSKQFWWEREDIKDGCNSNKCWNYPKVLVFSDLREKVSIRYSTRNIWTHCGNRSSWLLVRCEWGVKT